jgi:predicted nucleic acid-binding protein
MIVADTCLVIHLFNLTSLTEIAQKILDKDSNWILPTLWQEEYANVISKRARAEQTPVEEVVDLFAYTVNELKDAEHPIDNEKALRISLDYKISVYDAHFISLAIDFKTLLVTEDKEVIKKCPKFAIGMHDFLKLV